MGPEDQSRESLRWALPQMGNVEIESSAPAISPCRPAPLPVKLLCHRLEPFARGLDWEPQVTSVTMWYFSLKTSIRVQTGAASSLGYLSLEQICTWEIQMATTWMNFSPYPLTEARPYPLNTPEMSWSVNNFILLFCKQSMQTPLSAPSLSCTLLFVHIWTTTMLSPFALGLVSFMFTQ